MKRNLWAILLAIALTVCLLPTIGANAADSQGELMIRYATWDDNSECFYDDPNVQPLQSEYVGRVFSGDHLSFIFCIGNDEIRLYPEDLIYPDFVEIVWAEDHNGVCHINGFAPGEGTIDYEYNGQTYSLPFTFTLPDIWFYSSPTASYQTYLSEFKLTEDNNSFYFVAINGWTLTDIQIKGAYDTLTQLEKISDTCWKITINELSENDNHLYLYYSGTDMNGSEFTNWDHGIQIIDGMPGLFFRELWWDENGLYEDPNAPMQKSWNAYPFWGMDVRFYFFDGENEIPVSIDDLTCPDFLDLWSNDVAYSTIRATRPGEGTIDYVHGGKTYSISVSISLPEYAFYSSPTASCQTYLSEFKLTEDNNSFYFVAINGWILTDVQVEGAYDTLTQLEKISDTCWKITINELSGNDTYLQLYYNGTWPDGESFTEGWCNIEIVDAMPGLRYRYINSYENGYYEDMDSPLRNAWTATYNNSTRVKFYFFDGVDTFPLTINDLIIPSGITVNDLGNNFYRLRPTSFGSMSIDYVRDGVTYSLPVTVYLPEYAFYSSTTPSIPTYLSQFTLTEQNNVLYFVGRDGATLTSVWVEGAYADIAQLEKISDSCWKVTLPYIAPGDDDALQLIYSGTNVDGYEFTDWGYGLQIIDGMPGLRLRHMWWDNSTQQYYEDPSESLQKSWNASINNSSCVKFYFFDGQNEIPVSLSELTWSNCVTIEAVENQPYYRLRSIAFGNGTISYVRGGKTYTLPVSVGLPDFGFYSSEIPSEATYLSEFRMTADSKTFYFVAINGHTLTSVTAGYDYLQMEKISDSCWKITVTGPVPNSYFRLNYSGIFRWGETFTNYGYGFEIIDSTPGLRIRYMSWNKNTQEHYEDPTQPLQSAWSEWIGYSNSVKFYFFDGKNEFPVMLEELIVPDFIEIELMYNGAFYDIAGNTFGDGVISYVRDGVTYTLPVSVTLPGYGFYSSETPSIETYISEFAPSEDNKSFYFVSRNEGSFTDFALTNGLENIATFEHISDTCIKITVTGNYQVDRWYSVSYRFEGPGVTSSGSTGLRFVDTTPGLRLRQMRWDPDAQEYYEDLSSPLQNAWDTVINGWSGVKFYFFDGKNEFPVTLEELTIPDFLLVRLVRGTYYSMNAIHVGSGTIDYVRDGVTYSLPVSVELPFIGFYSSQTPSVETYINEFAPTADNNSFYLVTIGRTLNYVEITNVYANLAQVEQISDTCWKITVNMLSNVEQMEIYFEDEYGYGTRSIRIIDSSPGLRYRYMAGPIGDLYEDPSYQLENSWHTSLKTLSFIKFYFFDGQNEIPVTLDELIIPGCVDVCVNEGEDYYTIFSIRLGRGAIRYERDGVIYELPVSVGLPDTGFYTSIIPAWNTYLDGAFSVTEESNSLYYITLNGCTMSDLELSEELAAFATVTRISDTCWKFTFSDGFDPQEYYKFTFNATTAQGYTRQCTGSIYLHKPAPVASGNCDSTLTWSLTDDGVLTISGNGAATTAPWMQYSYLISKVVIKDGVTGIGDNAFVDCTNLTDIIIPETVTTIGKNAFAGCESLTTVTYAGSREQWNDIQIDENNDPLLNAVIFFDWNSDHSALLQDTEAAGLLQYLTLGDLNAGLTRLDAVKLLAAMMNITPIEGATLDFTDCADLTQAEKDLIAALVETGIIKGTGPDTFDPYAKLTHAELATMIYRALGEPETENSVNAPTSVWYLKPMLALQDLGIITQEDAISTAMNTMSVEGALRWMIKAKAVMDENNGGATIIPGDVNGDGLVNGTDTNLIFRYVSGNVSFTDNQLKAADVNGDNQVNGTDTNLVFRFVSGMIKDFN